MANVLMINASDRHEHGVSVKMYNQFVQSYKETHKQDTVEEVNLFEANLPYYGEKAIVALTKKAQQVDMTVEEEELVNTISYYRDQFSRADKLMIAFPLWNFTVPAPLITYLSYLAQAGFTFQYTENGPIGLAGDKEVVLLSARGGIYSEGTPMESAEMAMKLVRQTISLWGIVNPEEIVIEGHNAAPDQKERILEEGLTSVATAAGRF
ncbi:MULTISPECIES: FMN-dependent NADH-azoreductase [Shouchella]|uniref:FMN dependent NADH:quinone oxidoreductase n=3 Tax=Bacillaceae TaxID=186817 RepID=A0A060M6P6_9BACI|nr:MULTISPECIES: FMN-dependent NADH-azoreductase [Bacillaceae]RQW18850.1 FMN-dependent NADH-azoreductase [Bacillus sp. C1-1]AIC96243.1 FMN-dependent NADH-azoreductase [Shouchella lehensis G1]KQL58807.1 FMN-dependent NADH-azoreductase [Alkalicoccobacillus plakortidis]MBG9785135.1 FMN-dependent NADH-azoreductase [Shouchella lehensis]TES46569.1 FMN-dependent NADH-azoreductase [Shouchella lehensis]